MKKLQQLWLWLGIAGLALLGACDDSSDPSTTTTTTTDVSSPAPTQAGEDPPPISVPTSTTEVTAPAETTTTVTAPPEPATPPYLDPSLSVNERVSDLLSRMTLADKLGQMTLVEKGSITPNQLIRYGVGAILSGGGGAPAENTVAGWRDLVDSYMSPSLSTGLGIPVLYGVDAVHGHNNLIDAVIFPHNIGLGATNTPDLVTDIARATAIETAATNIRWNFAPVLAVPQDVRWGRTYEAYAEQTDLVTRMSAAYIRGLQGSDLTDPTSVLATAKHFVGDGGTAWDGTNEGYKIDQGVTIANEAELRQIHLAPYPDAIAAGALTVMGSFSSWENGKVHGDSYLMTDILRGELGFRGLLVSDWQAIDQIYPDDYYASVVQSINAGIDLNMVPYDFLNFITTLESAVANGDITEERIDEAVSRILLVKFEMGLFENPYTPEDLADQVGSDLHRAIARSAVSFGQVLLETTPDLLPLDPESNTPLLVAGTGANDVGTQSGGWTISWQGSSGDITSGTTILEAFESAWSGPVTYSSSGQIDGVDIAEGTIGVVVVSEPPYAEGVGDSETLRLANSQYLVIDRVRPLVDSLIVIMLTGRPVLWDPALDSADAVIAAWLPGTEGQGVVDPIVGNLPFNGTLTFTWPQSLDTLGTPRSEPCFDARYPYGYGLNADGSNKFDLTACGS